MLVLKIVLCSKLALVSLLCIITAGCASSSKFVESQRQTVEIKWDERGIPHIFAQNNRDLFFGYGYAVASQRLFQLEMLARTTRGQVSQVLGSEYVDLDTFIRTNFDLASIARQYKSNTHKYKPLIAAYTAGINHYVASVLADKKRLPKEYQHFQFEPRKWQELDAVMLFVGTMLHRYSDFNSELDNLKLLKSLQVQHGDKVGMQIFNSSKWLRDKNSPTTVANREVGASIPSDNSSNNTVVKAPSTKRVLLNSSGKFASISSKDQNLGDFQSWQSHDFHPASNIWLSNSISESNITTALLNGPQFGWALPSHVYSVAMYGGDFQLQGNTLVGYPALLFGQNGSIAWGSTAGISDSTDIFIEQLSADGLSYKHKGQFKPLKRWRESIDVKGADSQIVWAQKSVHGMIVHSDLATNTAYAKGANLGRSRIKCSIHVVGARYC